MLVLATKITGSFGLYEFHSFQDIINNLFGHQFTSQDFSTIDVNGDVQITTDEFSDELDQMPGTSLQAFSGTSIIAVMNALICTCDTDDSDSIDINESGTRCRRDIPVPRYPEIIPGSKYPGSKNPGSLVIQKSRDF